MLGHDAAVARAERPERPVVLAQRHLVERGASVAGAERAVANLGEDLSQLPQLGPQHVVDVDQVLADEPPAPAVGHLGAGLGTVRTGGFVPCRRRAEARSVVRRRPQPEPVDLRGRSTLGGWRVRSSHRPRAPRRPARAPPERPREDQVSIVLASSVVRMNVPMPSSSANRVSSAGESAPGTFSSLRIADGSRPAPTAASSITAFPAARSPVLEVGQAREPPVRLAADQVQHARLVRADPDLDVVQRRGSASRVDEPVVGPSKRAGSGCPTSQSDRITSIASSSASTRCPGSADARPSPRSHPRTRRRRARAPCVHRSGRRGSRPRARRSPGREAAG